MFELTAIAFGLSMDAFAVAVSKGMRMQTATAKHMLTVGLYFGLFQAGMPVIGYLLGAQFAGFVDGAAPWIAFALLGVIGGKMIFESCSKKQEIEDKQESDSTLLKPRVMLLLAIATSIDALATGVTFAFLRVNIVLASLLIGVITLVMSMLGVKIGCVFGLKFKAKAEFAGGVVLILMGIKILVEHLWGF